MLGFVIEFNERVVEAKGKGSITTYQVKYTKATRSKNAGSNQNSLYGS